MHTSRLLRRRICARTITHNIIFVKSSDRLCTIAENCRQTRNQALLGNIRLDINLNDHVHATSVNTLSCTCVGRTYTEFNVISWWTEVNRNELIEELLQVTMLYALVIITFNNYLNVVPKFISLQKNYLHVTYTYGFKNHSTALYTSLVVLFK